MDIKNLQKIKQNTLEIKELLKDSIGDVFRKEAMENLDNILHIVNKRIQQIELNDMLTEATGIKHYPTVGEMLEAKFIEKGYITKEPKVKEE